MPRNRFSSQLSSSSPHSRVGWHFQPRGREVEYFLMEKNKNSEFSAQPIVTCDIYESNPEELARKYQVEGENMYFFTQLNLKNDGGSRANRQAKDGFWVSSDGYKHVEHQGNSIGYKQITLNFYKGVKSKGKKTNCLDEQPKSMKTDWLMKEYRLDEVKTPTVETTACGRKGRRVAETQDDNPKKMKKYVLCQIYEKSKAKKTNKATTNQIDRKKSVAKKTSKDLNDEVITKESTSFFTPDQPNIISNECLPATPGMQIYSLEDTFTDFVWEDYFTLDQPNNISNECLPATPGMQIYSQEDTFTDFIWEDYFTPDEPNNISNECLPATPDMQIYS